MPAPRPHVAIATCAALPDLDEDGPALLDALRHEGIDATPRSWDDEGVDWAAHDAVIVRCTWDYWFRRDEFIAWATRVGAQTRLLNDAPTLRWNTDKHYLVALAAAGAPVAPTAVLEPGDALPPLRGRTVIKPAVSAGAQDSGCFEAGDDAGAAALTARIHASGRAVLVQPYLDAVDSHGETALLFFDGVFSHAIRKAALLKPGEETAPSLFEPETITPRCPSAAERRAAEAVLAHFARLSVGAVPPLYARVDLIAGDDGGPLLLELELTEPSLFLGYAEGAAARFASAVARRLVA